MTGYGSKIAQPLNSPVHAGTLALPVMSHFYIHSTLYDGQPHNKTRLALSNAEDTAIAAINKHTKYYSR